MCLLRYQNVKKLDKRKLILPKYNYIKGNLHLLKISTSSIDNRIDNITSQKIEAVKIEET